MNTEMLEYMVGYRYPAWLQGRMPSPTLVFARKTFFFSAKINLFLGTRVENWCRNPYPVTRSLKKKQKKSQGSSRYRTGGEVELTALPLLKG